MINFSELLQSPLVRKNIAAMSISEATPVQAQAIPPAMLGQDVVATAPTGTGKTLAFVLPVVERLLQEPNSTAPRALVLTPTRELATQIYEVFNAVSAGTHLRSALVVGGLAEQRQLQSLRRGAQIIIATPGRLGDFLKRRLAPLEGVRIVVLDEADRMLDMGFLPAVEDIVSRCAPQRQTLFFSATFESSVSKLITKYTKDPVRITTGSTTTPSEQVETHVYEVEQDRKLGLLQHLLDTEPGSFLVFARTKHGAERLSKKVAALGFKSAAIHGDRSQNQRQQALRGFQNGQYRVLVATDVAARGIHVDSIAHVVNYDLPQAPEDFVHRVGRTGRAGSSGVASTFATRSERGEIGRLERALKTKLVRMPVDPGIKREDKSAPVIVIPVRNRYEEGRRPSENKFRPRRTNSGR